MSRLSRWAVVTTVAAFALSGCEFNGAYDLPLPGSPVDEGDSYVVTAEFEDILNIVPRSPIMVDDVTVGEVTEVDRVGWHAKITMRVRDDVVLPDNAIAQIRQVSLLGEKYVALEAPSEIPPEGQLGEGDNIGLDRTGRNPEVEEVLGALSFLLSGGGVAQLGTITQELNNAMTGRTQDLRSLLGSLDRVIGTLDDQKGDIIHALESVNSLTATLNREKSTIQGALDVAGPAVAVLADQEDELIKMLTSLDRLGVIGTRVIRASKENLLDQLRDLQPVLSNLSKAGDSLAPGLNLLVSFPFPKEASEIVQGDYANTSIRADISLENFLPAGVQLPEIPGLPGIPGIPGIPGLPDLSVVQKCLRSHNVASVACVKVLGSLTLLPQLAQDCRKRKFRHGIVCRTIGSVDLGGDGGPQLPGLPGLPGLSRVNVGLASGQPGPAPGDLSHLFGGSS